MALLSGGVGFQDHWRLQMGSRVPGAGPCGEERGKRGGRRKAGGYRKKNKETGGKRNAAGSEGAARYMEVGGDAAE